HSVYKSGGPATPKQDRILLVVVFQLLGPRRYRRVRPSLGMAVLGCELLVHWIGMRSSGHSEKSRRRRLACPLDRRQPSSVRRPGPGTKSKCVVGLVDTW